MRARPAFGVVLLTTLVTADVATAFSDASWQTDDDDFDDAIHNLNHDHEYAAGAYDYDYDYDYDDALHNLDQWHRDRIEQSSRFRAVFEEERQREFRSHVQHVLDEFDRRMHTRG